MRWLTLRVFRLTFLSLVIFDMARYLSCFVIDRQIAVFCIAKLAMAHCQAIRIF